IIVLAIIGIGAFMVIFVLPNITSLFTELDVELPLATKIMIFVSNSLQQQGLIILIVLAAILAVFIKAVRTPGGHGFFSALTLKIPVLSSIIKKINLARIARNLSSLIKTDIAIVETLNITSRIIGNPQYRKALVETAEKVKKGGKMADSLKNYPHIFPPIIIQMISVGEETGALDEILENLASFYEEDVSQTMETLPTIIEPILMLFIGAVVAGVALAILMPMYSLTENF
ncbi:MAG: type II secretion system F family protein, partial [Patescibacteria group bacterium]